ncbi:Histidine kinase-, DNA gyrase B-, and HSP90-like ATPase [Spirosomataceae bacterium TFI 002]|nr:Histidine kinase-, DNA gyrase B-, and HSP90-like ATPase [Spirosomataceae bacterium TFI 002]
MEVNEVVIVIIGGTLIMLVLVIFIISFFFIHARRQQAYKLEKAAMASQFNEEILTARNEVQEYTMKQIAREIHDNIGQLLSLVKIQLNNIEDEHPDIPRVKDSRTYLNQALGDLRALSKTLNGENILNAGLSDAIAFELERVAKTGYLETDFQNHTTNLTLPPKTEIIVFRMFQEVLQNVMKHANAKKFTVNLQEQQEVYTLVLADDGDGFEIDQKLSTKGMNSGSGLANLKHRAGLLGGDIQFKSDGSQGTMITLTIPKYHYKYDEGSTS